jgi:hypothetical protein
MAPHLVIGLRLHGAVATPSPNLSINSFRRCALPCNEN